MKTYSVVIERRVILLSDSLLYQKVRELLRKNVTLNFEIKS